MPEPRSHGLLRERIRRPPERRFLVQPVVTERVLVLEPVGRDPFIDGPDDLDRCPSRERVTGLRRG